MVTIYNVGPDELIYEYDEMVKDERYEWIVYWYQTGDYDGSGEAAMYGKDGKLYTRGLGHCSCYGPLDGWATDQPVAVEPEKFFADKDSIWDHDCKDAIKQKVGELLAALPSGKVFGEPFDFLNGIK